MYRVDLASKSVVAVLASSSTAPTLLVWLPRSCFIFPPQHLSSFSILYFTELFFSALLRLCVLLLILRAFFRMIFQMNFKCPSPQLFHILNTYPEGKFPCLTLHHSHITLLFFELNTRFLASPSTLSRFSDTLSLVPLYLIMQCTHIPHFTLVLFSRSRWPCFFIWINSTSSQKQVSF